MKKFFIICSMIAVLILSACAVPGTSKTPSGSEGSQDDTTIAAVDFELESIDGSKVRLSDLKGKPVVINFFTTWCVYCDRELPYFMSAKDEYADEVTFLFIDVQESISDVKNYVEKKGYDNFLPLLDSDGSVARTYGVNGYPNTIIVDADGNIAEVYRGMMGEDMLKKAVEAVRVND